MFSALLKRSYAAGRQRRPIYIALCAALKRIIISYLKPAEVLAQVSRDQGIHGIGLRNRVVAHPAPLALAPWMHDQVDKELKFFSDGITPERLLSAEVFYGEEYHSHYAHYSVRAGELHCPSPSKSFPTYIANRFYTMTQVFKALASSLPDIDFLIYLGDGFDGWSEGCCAPVLTFSKRVDLDVSGLLIPDPLTLASSCKLRAQAQDGCAAFPWASRKPVAYWRGSTTGGPYTLDNYSQGVRFQLVEWSRCRPDLVDAAFTGFHGSTSAEIRSVVQKGNKLARHVDIHNHFRFRYQVLVDGFTSPWPRFFWAMHGDSAIFKQQSKLRGWFDAGVQPWIHYIPLCQDLADLSERVLWARTHELEIRQMVIRALDFTRESLSDAAMLSYIRLLLMKYAELLKGFEA